jgi:hypothetical protein
MKHREFAMTIQNVQEDKAYEWLKEYTTNPQVKEYSYSVEPYNHQPGHHLHLFVQYKNQRHFSALHKEINRQKGKILALRPEGEERDWGRLWIQAQKGKLEECEAYLQGATKSKALGEVFTGRTKVCWRRFRWKKLSYIGTKIERGKLEECCGRCWSNLCRGCCEGCQFCDETHPYFSQEGTEKMEKKNLQARKKYLV